MTAATKTTGRQCRVTARNTTQVASATMRIAWVAPSVLKISLQRVRPGVRWAANQREIGAGLGFQSFGDRGGQWPAGRAPGQLEGECRDPEPGDAERPGAHDVGQVVHAEEDPADADQGGEGG